MFLLTDIEDDNRAATAKEIDFLNELKLLWLKRNEDKNTLRHMTDLDESEKGNCGSVSGGNTLFADHRQTELGARRTAVCDEIAREGAQFT